MTTLPVTLVVMAKSPQPGRSKTRLCPPCRPEQAAALAEAALADTLDAVRATPAVRHVLALDGEEGPWLPDGFDVIDQRGSGLGERLAAAVTDVGGAVFVVGMDTPQLTAELLLDACCSLTAADPGDPGALGARADAALGPARDGGYWGIGLARADGAVFDGVPMSTSETGARQLDRLEALGLTVRLLPPLVDVDHFADAIEVAALVPEGRFAAGVRAIMAELGPDRVRREGVRPTHPGSDGCPGD